MTLHNFEQYISMMIIGVENMEDKKLFRSIGTHDGKFHADEVMATAILKELFEVKLIRTRNEDTLKEIDIIYDIGGGKFDHHGADKDLRDNDIPYASCGLIWKKFGRKIISNKIPSLKEDEIESIFYYVDKALILGIDAHDNGVKDECEEESIPHMNISILISGFNPPWYSDEDEDEAFNKAVELSSTILNNTIRRRLGVIKAKEEVISAYEKRETPYILFLDRYCPWAEALQNIDKNNQVLFVIFPDDHRYNLLTVKDSQGNPKKPLPLEWAGKRDKELAAVTGIEDAIFCHSGRFIAVAKSLAGIKKMARLAAEYIEIS